MSMSISGSGSVGVRILLVALDPSGPPVGTVAEGWWRPDSRWWPWAVAAPTGHAALPDHGGLSIDPAEWSGPAQGLRGLGAKARTTLLARKHGADASGLWALKRSAEFRQAVREADLVCGLDATTDAVLEALPDLLGDRAVLTSQQWAAAFPVMALLHGLLAGLVTPEGSTVDEHQVSALHVADLPGQVQALTMVGDASRTDQRLHGRRTSRANFLALDHPDWPAEQRRSTGLAARWAAADLSLGVPLLDTRETDGVRAVRDDEGLAELSDAALEGADAALAAGQPELALDRLTDGMALIFHRARHSEVLSSPLVEDPAGFLATFVHSRTLRTLLRPTPNAGADAAGGPPCAPSSRGVEGQRAPKGSRPPRALVVTGAYGSFHQTVVAALRERAEVKTRDFTKSHPHLERKLLDPDALPMLAALVALSEGSDVSWIEEAVRQEVTATVETMRPMLAWADVVFADWADRSTVFVSHVVPPGTRLIVRIHAVDALDPWLHLTRWDRVERVIVVSEPMRSLVTELLATLGAQVSVVVMHVITGLQEMGGAKSPGARTTLGMIGWGRRVKDPLWALDLLERDPSWRLVLIGPDFPADPGPLTEPYVARLRERLASPSLRDRVKIVGATRDVATPMAEVGVILSASMREGWHLGLVEGASSGAVPVVRNWPLLASRGGPRLLYPPSWVVDDLDAAEARVREVTAPRRWEEESSHAREVALGLFDPGQVALDYRHVILDGLGPEH